MKRNRETDGTFQKHLHHRVHKTLFANYACFPVTILASCAVWVVPRLSFLHMLYASLPWFCIQLDFYVFMLPTHVEIQQRCWRWIGNTLRKPATNTAKQALRWNPQGKRKRGRPQKPWRRDLDADAKKMGHTWGRLERLAQDRDGWRDLVSGLCPRRGNRHR